MQVLQLVCPLGQMGYECLQGVAGTRKLRGEKMWHRYVLLLRDRLLFEFSSALMLRLELKRLTAIRTPHIRNKWEFTPFLKRT